MPILSVKNLTKRFGSSAGGFVAVNDISFDLQEGEILGFLGPNGAGKTTTIQMLLGLLTPSAGTIEYFGKNLTQQREDILESINFSSTYTHLPWRLTVKENLRYTSYFYKIDNRKERLNYIFEIFKLEPLLNQKISDLSAGQTTRVNLAKAFINFPKALLLDEPTASLDPDVAKYIRDFLKNQQEKFKVSILFTSHNMAEVEEICDRVIFINNGKIVADDTPVNLSKKLKVSHVSLMIRDGAKRIATICNNQKLSYKFEDRFVVVDVEERRIPDLLKEILEAGIVYDEISIDKPTLEDYFLYIASKKKS